MDLHSPSFPEVMACGFPPLLALFLAFIPCLHAQQTPLSLEAKEHGKEITIRADSQQKDKDIYHLRGHVQIVYEEMRVTADEASFDDASGEVIARGHVIFDDPLSHLTAEEVHYNIQTQKGWFSNGVGYVHSKGPTRPRVLKTENPFYIWGETVDRLDEDTYSGDTAA